MCPCEHAINFHESLTGRCHAKRDKPTTYDTDGTPRAWLEVACDCQVYAGPELIRGITGSAVIPLPEYKEDGK